MRFYLTCFALSFGGFAAIISMVLLSGMTFGQRCARAFPSDLVQQEACMIRLDKGLPIYKENEQ